MLHIFLTNAKLLCRIVGTLPNFSYLTNARLDNITFTEEDILLLIRNLQPGKANGPDEISACMILLCDDSIVLPLKLIFQNILLTVYSRICGNEQM